MDEEKQCCDEGCKCQSEESPTFLENPSQSDQGYVSCDAGLHYAPDYQSGNISFNVGSNANKIQDTVIKQMDYGYLVKVGCQTLCIENHKDLAKLLKAYLEDPQKVMKAYYKGELKSILTEQVLDEFKDRQKKKKTQYHFAVIGSNQRDVLEYLRCTLGGAYYKKGSAFVVETEEVDLLYYGVTTPNHSKGMRFDNIIETYRARENRDFQKLIEGCKIAMQR